MSGTERKMIGTGTRLALGYCCPFRTPRLASVSLANFNYYVLLLGTVNSSHAK